MVTLEVGIWQTGELTNDLDSVGNKWSGAARVKTYLEGAFSHSGNPHSINASVMTEKIPALTEHVTESFTADYPCDRSFELSYDNLNQWWEDYIKCNLTDKEDCVLLLTNRDSGAGLCTSSHYATAEGGFDMGMAPGNYERYGDGDEFSSLSTALHEAGHAFLGKSTEFEHNAGTVVRTTTGVHRTPFGDDGMTEDACGNSVPYDWHHSGHQALYFNPDCTVNHIEHTD